MGVCELYKKLIDFNPGRKGVISWVRHHKREIQLIKNNEGEYLLMTCVKPDLDVYEKIRETCGKDYKITKKQTKTKEELGKNKIVKKFFKKNQTMESFFKEKRSEFLTGPLEDYLKSLNQNPSHEEFDIQKTKKPKKREEVIYRDGNTTIYFGPDKGKKVIRILNYGKNVIFYVPKKKEVEVFKEKNGESLIEKILKDLGV